MRLTIPETVTLFNRERMMKIVNTGPDELGGALYVEKKYDGSRFDLKFAGSLSTIALQLKVGDIVERMLQDGDLVSAFILLIFLQCLTIMYIHTGRGQPSTFLTQIFNYGNAGQGSTCW